MARSGLCIFCGKGPLTDEHIFGKWSTPLFAAPLGKRAFIDSERLINGVNVVQRRYPKGPDLQVKRVCGNCNHGWMATLEGATKKIFFGIQDGSLKTLTAHQQDILASWATKTAIVIQYFGESFGVPPRRRDWMFKHHRPPPDTAVWLGRYDGPAVVTSESRQLFLGQVDNKISVRNHAQAVTLTIGPLLFVVLALYTNPERVKIKVEFPVPFKQHLFQIWGPDRRDTLDWPSAGLSDPFRTSLAKLDWSEALWWQFHLPPPAAKP